MTGEAGSRQRLGVDVDYHQYYVFDQVAEPDWSVADDLCDGILSPLRTGVKVSTGIQWGLLCLDLVLARDVELAGPSAACDIWVESGVINIGSVDTAHPFALNVNHSGWIRVTVSVERRDDSLFVPLRGPHAEVHTLVLQPTHAPTRRWVSDHMDQVGIAARDIVI